MIFCTVANMVVISKNVVEGCSLSMDKPSLESMAEVLTVVKQSCGVAHRGNTSSQKDYLARRCGAFPTDLLQVDPHLSPMPMDPEGLSVSKRLLLGISNVD